jgi:hypothetical protein
VAKEKKCHKATKPTKVHKAPCWDILLQLLIKRKCAGYINLSLVGRRHDDRGDLTMLAYR